MTEPNTAPTAGEPAAPPEGGDTPAGGAADTPGNSDPEPKTKGPADIEAMLTKRFRDGYGKGADKGRREGAEQVFQTLGIGNSLDEALAWVESRRDLSEAPKLDVKDTPEFRELKAELYQKSKAVEAMEKQLQAVSAQADTARVARLESLAIKAGVGAGRQFEAFMRMHGDAVRFDSDHNLEVVERVNGEAVPTGQPVEDWLASVVAADRFLLAVDPQKTGGTGSRIGPAKAPAPTNGFDRYEFAGTAPPKTTSG